VRWAGQSPWRLFAVVALVLAGCGSPAAPFPNVILIVIDTLRADHVSGYGYHRETTPTLDRLIRGGVRFDAAIAHTSWSAPSHTTIITGTLPVRHRIHAWGDALPESIAPLAVRLKELGFATGLFSTHRILHGTIGGITRGIDTAVVKSTGQEEEVLRRASDWAVQQREPFFLYVVPTAPHAPYDNYPPEDDRVYFTDTPPGGERSYKFGEQKWVGQGVIPGSVRIGNHRKLGFYINRYDRGVRYTDELIGRFLDRLEKSGRLENTLIIVTADHGEGLGDHDAFAHELFLYDFLVRVPLIVHFPEAVPAGQVWREQVQLVDIVPTILGFLGAAAPDGTQGVDLSRHLTRRTRLEGQRFVRATYLARGYHRFMVRTTGYKLIYDADERTTEFYHLESDPAEERNLAAEALPAAHRSAYAAHLAELQQLIESYAGFDVESRPAPSLSPEMIAELQAMGYLDAEEDAAESASRE
jgi:arylsulfatase A-like enzyme